MDAPARGLGPLHPRTARAPTGAHVCRGPAGCCNRHPGPMGALESSRRDASDGVSSSKSGSDRHVASRRIVPRSKVEPDGEQASRGRGAAHGAAGPADLSRTGSPLRSRPLSPSSRCLFARGGARLHLKELQRAAAAALLQEPWLAAGQGAREACVGAVGDVVGRAGPGFAGHVAA